MRQSSGREERMARTAVERFSTPQLTLTGANQPGTSRLYELTVGLSSNEAAGKCSRIPAMDACISSGSGADEPGGAKALLSPLQQDMWMWPLEPSSPDTVLARKLARNPIDAASSLTANLTRSEEHTSELQSRE